MRVRFTFLIILALVGVGCTSTNSQFQSDEEAFQSGLAMLERLDIRSNAKNWDELKETSWTALRTCLEVASEKADDKSSPANRMAQITAAACSDYFRVAEFAALEGETPLPRVKEKMWSSRLSIAEEYILRNRGHR